MRAARAGAGAVGMQSDATGGDARRSRGWWRTAGPKYNARPARINPFARPSRAVDARSRPMKSHTSGEPFIANKIVRIAASMVRLPYCAETATGCCKSARCSLRIRCTGIDGPHDSAERRDRPDIVTSASQNTRSRCGASFRNLLQCFVYPRPQATRSSGQCAASLRSLPPIRLPEPVLRPLRLNSALRARHAETACAFARGTSK